MQKFCRIIILYEILPTNIMKHVVIPLNIEVGKVSVNMDLKAMQYDHHATVLDLPCPLLTIKKINGTA